MSTSWGINWDGEMSVMGTHDGYPSCIINDEIILNLNSFKKNPNEYIADVATDGVCRYIDFNENGGEYDYIVTINSSDTMITVFHHSRKLGTISVNGLSKMKKDQKTILFKFLDNSNYNVSKKDIDCLAKYGHILKFMEDKMNKKDIEYKIIKQPGIVMLIDEVNKSINNGFSIVGPVQFESDGYVQTLVRRESEPENKIVDLIVISRENPADLNAEAQEYINKGYQPEKLVDAEIDTAFLNSRSNYTICLVKRMSDVVVGEDDV